MNSQKITEDEILFMESWHNPICMIECLFSDFDNLTEFDEEKMGNIRLYQIPMFSHEPIIDDEQPGLTLKQNFKLRKNVGDIINIGARKFGKTLVTEKLDVPISMLHDAGWPVGFSSADSIHLREVLDDIKRAMETHPILKMWHPQVRTTPSYSIVAKNGWRLAGINMNLNSKEPGDQFFGKHVRKLWIEETSFETEKVYEKRIESYSELGAVLRISGMTNFTRYSPTGKTFFDSKNRNKVLNLPQYVNPMWDEEEEEKRCREYGGKESLGYRVFVKGEVIEDGVSEIDMVRFQEQCVMPKKEIKRFEIQKKQFSYFDSLIVVERPKNAERIFINADIGEGAGTDIIILSEIGDHYVYLYNIILYSMTRKEQLKIFKWLIQKMKANVIALDCGDAMGRNLADDLEDAYSKENVVRYDGGAKIKVGYETEKNGDIKMENGKPVYRYEYMKEWSVNRLKVIFYEGRCKIPKDYKLEAQLSVVISTTSGTRKIYECVHSSGNHLFEAWRVFFIAEWLKHSFNDTPIMVGNAWGAGASSWT